MALEPEKPPNDLFLEEFNQKTDSTNEERDTGMRSSIGLRRHQEELVFDVLPSFELYQSFQKDSEGYSEEGGSPPEYLNGGHESPTTPRTTLALESNHYNTITPEDHNLVDSAQELPLVNAPIVMDIHVIKDVPDPSKPQEQESYLKEYTSGDAVYGYIIVRNTSDKPIRFQKFYVSLDCFVSIIDVQQKMLISKKILSMMDLSASWSCHDVGPSANMKPFIYGTIDFEGAVLGLRDDRILEPGVKYKKFFTFKFPNALLDTVCRHGLDTHISLPPSFGINNLKHKNIIIDPYVHYGHLYNRGSPILTQDLSCRENAISYSISSRIIGVENQNNPNGPSTPGKLVRLAENEYSLRFIPFGVTPTTSDRYGSLEKLCSSIESTLKDAEIYLKVAKEGRTKEVEDFYNSIKFKQLSVRSPLQIDQLSIQTNYFGSKPTTTNFEKPLIEGKLRFTTASSNKFKLFDIKTNFNVAGGLILATSIVPKHTLSYQAPSAIKKTNELSKLNKRGLDNHNKLYSSLSPNEKQELQKIEVDLKFMPANNTTSDYVPPDVEKVRVQLIVNNMYSPLSIPVELSASWFTNGNTQVQTKFMGYYSQINNLKEQFKELDVLKDFDDYIDKAFILDVEAMMKIQTDEHKAIVFKSLVNTSESTSWLHKSEKEWCKKLIIDLSYLSNNLSTTIVPTFQSCLISRQYSLDVEITLKKDIGCVVLNIPVSVGKFDD